MMGMIENILYIFQKSYDGSTSYPLLFSFHGGGGISSDFINVNDMRPIDTAGFIAIYPQAATDPEDGSFSWLISLQLLIMIYSSLKQLLIHLVINT